MAGITENVSFRLPEEALRSLPPRGTRERRSA
jgi:hypothetical protein